MMVKVGAASVAFVMLSVAPAFAQFGCVDPIAPAAVDGSKATKQQMAGAHDDVVDFIKSSDDYQSCLMHSVDTQKQEAAKKLASDPKATPFDPNVEKMANAKIDENQRLKEKVGAEYNAAVHAYKAAHPGG